MGGTNFANEGIGPVTFGFWARVRLRRLPAQEPFAHVAGMEPESPLAVKSRTCREARPAKSDRVLRSQEPLKMLGPSCDMILHHCIAVRNRF